METIKDIISNRLKVINDGIIKVKQETLDTPKVKLRIYASSKNKKVKFYIRKKSERNGKYISSKQMELIKKIAQQQYNETLLKKLLHEQKILKQFIRTYTPENFAAIYDKYHYIRKTLVTPLYISNEKYAENWINVKYEPLHFDAGDPAYIVSENLHVRSKSEMIIAQALKNANIPFRYEFPVSFEKHSTFYPDFLCLNKRTREEFFWEHLGMMGDDDYAAKNIHKLNLFIKNGFFPGKNLILTMECKSATIQIETINKLINEYLK